MSQVLPEWLKEDWIQPYLFVRKENRSSYPGSSHPINWFEHKKPIVLDPLSVESVNFAECIYSLESAAFEESAMPMPRWVFFDCAIMPGVITGFAIHRDKLNSEIKKKLKPDPSLEWVPVSLFIAIPTNMSGQWVAHNLSSLNSLLPREERLKGLGFLSKAFGLWYANIKNLCGMTQWGSPALKLHSHYGNLEVVTAYTPVHSYASTVTYRTWVDSRMWSRFFSKESSPAFQHYFKKAGFEVDPKESGSQKSFQAKIESGQGPFYLSEDEIRSNKLTDKLNVFVLS